MKISRENLLLYAVTDRRWLNGDTLASQVEKALKGGVTCIQLREKELETDEFLAEALEIGRLCRRYGVPFIIDDDPEIAVKCGADGIHVGQNDMNARELRRLVGDDMIIGVSARTIDSALEAVQNGADYIGAGAVFSTSTKNDAKPLDRETLKQICSSVPIPVVAIGGITKDNILELSGSGISGAAVVSAIFAQSNIEQAASQMLELSRKMAGVQ